MLPATLESLCRAIPLLALTSIACVASAQGEYAWDGVYAGLNAGEGRNSTCTNWTLNAPSDSAVAAVFSNRNCPNNSSFVGGVEIGDNFQYSRLVWGFGAEFDAWGAKNQNSSFKYTGAVPPPGTYAVSGKLNPSGFGIIGPHIGYAGDHWLPYLRVGAVITGGSRNTTLEYTPTGTAKSVASFSGGKNFTSTGWVVGGGVEFVLTGPWAVSAEYTRVNLGGGTNSTSTCAGTAAVCAEFSGISFESTHNGFTANLFRIGINYWFGY